MYEIGERCADCHPNDTCPDGRLCREYHLEIKRHIACYNFGTLTCIFMAGNPERDKVLPGPSDAGMLKYRIWYWEMFFIAKGQYCINGDLAS